MKRKTVDKALALGLVGLGSYTCRGCGCRLEVVPGYGDFIKGSKLHCPNRCHPENYRDINGVRA